MLDSVPYALWENADSVADRLECSLYPSSSFSSVMLTSAVSLLTYFLDILSMTGGRALKSSVSVVFVLFLPSFLSTFALYI